MVIIQDMLNFIVIIIIMLLSNCKQFFKGVLSFGFCSDIL